MPSCPKCKQPVDTQAILCPRCQNPLKAYGHPGIPLHQSEDNTSLCDRCIYHLDDTCNFPQRPDAYSCTLFHDVAIPLVPPQPDIPPSRLGWRGVQNWFYRYRSVIAIALLLVVSVVLALGSR